jgi:hypothetical protein
VCRRQPLYVLVKCALFVFGIYDQVVTEMLFIKLIRHTVDGIESLDLGSEYKKLSGLVVIVEMLDSKRIASRE